MKVGLILISLLVLSPAAHAIDYTVNTTEDLAEAPCDRTSCLFSLRMAVRDANKNPGLDTIILPAGTYKLTLKATYTSGLDPKDGPLIILDDLVVTGSGAEKTTIAWLKGMAEGEIFDVEENVSVVIKGLTLSNARLHAILTRRSSSLLVQHSVLSNNGYNDRMGSPTYCSGRAIEAFESENVIVENSILKGNCRGILAQGTKNLTVKDNLIAENYDGDGWRWSYDKRRDAGTSGAGIEARFTQLSLVNTTITRNKCKKDLDGDCECAAGGIFLLLGPPKDRGGTPFPNNSKILNSTISGNESCRKAGGLSVMKGSTLGLTPPMTLTISNSTITGNRISEAVTRPYLAKDKDGIVYYSSYGDSGGMFLFSEPFPDVILKNTIIANNKVLGTAMAPECFGPVISKRNNLVRDTKGCSGLDVALDDIIGIDPLLGPLQDNGGPTPTHHPLPGSLAIDGAGGCPPPDVDQRGIKRPNGLECDIGAVEAVQKTIETPWLIPHDPKFMISLPVSDPPREIVIKKPPPPPGPFVSRAGALICSSNWDGTYSLVNNETGKAFVIDRPCSADGTIPADAVILYEGTVVPANEFSLGLTPGGGSCVSPLPPNVRVTQTDFVSSDQTTSNRFTTISPTDSDWRMAVFGQKTESGVGVTTDSCLDTNLSVPDGEVMARGVALMTSDRNVDAVRSEYRVKSRVVEPVSTANPMIVNTMMTTEGIILTCHLQQGETFDLCNENFPADRLDRTTLRSEFTWSVDRFTGDRISEAATYILETRLVDQFTVLRMKIDQTGVGNTSRDPGSGMFQGGVKVGDLVFERNGGDSVGRVVPLGYKISIRGS